MKLEELLKKATPVEKWKKLESRISPGEFRLRHTGVEGVLTKEDAALIIHAVNMLPKLVVFIQSAKEAADGCEDSLEGLIELRGWLADRADSILTEAKEVAS